MHYCPACHHFHGQGDHWAKCLAITRSETGGAQRCTCHGPTNQQENP